MTFNSLPGESICDTEKRLQNEALYNQLEIAARNAGISDSHLDELQHKCGKSVELLKQRMKTIPLN